MSYSTKAKILFATRTIPSLMQRYVVVYYPPEDNYEGEYWSAYQTTGSGFRLITKHETFQEARNACIDLYLKGVADEKTKSNL